MELPDWKSLSALDPTELDGQLREWLNKVMEGKYGYPEEDQILAELPEPLQALWLLQWMDFEVTMGSLLAYFGNHQRPHAPAAIRYLRLIGAPGMASVLERATAIFDANAQEWGTRDEQINELEQYAVVQPYKDLPGVDELSDLTDRYYELEKQERWRVRLADYLHRTVADLARTE